ncbi:MAG: SpoIIE family protein phosphatase, partial [Actinomycetota bacterium]|nr:SpoIIE family protein phosphatase [Actinomycetota bacterium]
GVALPLGPHDVVLAWTDGLTDRHGEVDLLDVLVRLRPALGPTPDAGELVRAVVQACGDVGPAQDDETLVALGRA